MMPFYHKSDETLPVMLANEPPEVRRRYMKTWNETWSASMLIPGATVDGASRYADLIADGEYHREKKQDAVLRTE